MAHGGQLAEPRLLGVQQLLDRRHRTGEPVGHASQLAQPARRAGQRHAHVPAAALDTLARQRGQRAEGHQVAAGMIEDLHRHGLGGFLPGRLGLGMVEAGGRLHQRVEAAPAGPRTAIAVGRQRHVHDAGTDARGVLRAETQRLQAAGPVALHEHMRAVIDAAGESGLQTATDSVLSILRENKAPMAVSAVTAKARRRKPFADMGRDDYKASKAFIDTLIVKGILLKSHNKLSVAE